MTVTDTTSQCFAYDMPCDCMTQTSPTSWSSNEVFTEWTKKSGALLRALGLFYMNDPGGGGFYDTKTGQRVMSESQCPKETFNLLSKLFAERQGASST